MKAELISYMGSDLSAVNAARVSMDKNSDWEWCGWDGSACGDNCKDTGESCPRLNKFDNKLITYLAKNKHDSCFEHQVVTIRLKVPLFVRSQIHRHRTFSYNEISRRYVKDNLEFYWPDNWRKAADNVKQGSSDDIAVEFSFGDMSDEQCMHNLHTELVNMYNWMINKYNICPEQARMILPQNLYTQFYMTGNLRNWCHFLKLRLDPHAQKEIRDVAEMVANIIKTLFPVSYAALMET